VSDFVPFSRGFLVLCRPVIRNIDSGDVYRQPSGMVGRCGVDYENVMDDPAKLELR
jgi:hypothetical protein